MAMIYEDSKDLHVKAVVVYVDTSKAYKDSEKTQQFEAQELKDAFVRGALVATSTGYAVPTAFSMSDGTATITTADGTYSSKAGN